MGAKLEPGLFGAIEAGGTKINMAVGTGAENIVASLRVQTTTPEVTIAAILAFFEPFADRIASFGIASFGPVRIDKAAPDWGCLLATPKLGWSGKSFVHPLIERFGVPIDLDTDVNAAALAECRFGALSGLHSAAYMTVGTGIGVGVIVDGKAIRGVLHPEIGHIPVRRLVEDAFAGCCPYHADCLEGLSAGPAIEARYGAILSQLPRDHIAYRLVADYIGRACATVALSFSAERIVIGGGVFEAPGLHAATAARLRRWLGGYLTDERFNLDSYVVPPGLGGQAGLTGALLLAQEALNRA